MNNKKTLIISITTILILTLISGGIFYYLKKPQITELEKQGEIGNYILTKDFQQKPILPIKQTDTNYQLTDSLINGPTITYANPPEELKDKSKNEQNLSVATDRLNIEFPKNYPEPINIKLDEQRIITIKDNTGIKYNSKLIEESLPLDLNHESRIMNQEIQDPEHLEQGNDRTLQQSQHASYLKYQSKDKRISTYYAYQKANNQRTLKHWTIYSKPNKDQEEKESYQINNAKLKLNSQGEVEVYYFGEQDLKNEEVKAQVDSNLMARAQRTLQKELGEDILNTNNHTPDFIIPAPYYITKNQARINLNWELNQDSNTIEVKFQPGKDEYPIGLDPTIQFTAPGQGDTSDSIILNPTDWEVGKFMVGGDFNADGRVDLAISSISYNNSIGRVYIFYNDGSIPTTAVTADVIITGENTSDYFGSSIVGGDFNNDGKEDLIVGAYRNNNYTGRVYIFYNDGVYPALASQADIIISGEFNSYFGVSMTKGDFDSDGKDDLVIGANNYSGSVGRVYIFYNDGVITSLAANADLKISGGLTGYFGYALATGDFNYDSKIDLAVGCGSEFSAMSGSVYIFYNDGSMPLAATVADVSITGENSSYFGYYMTKGDFNYDGRTDLAVGAYAYSTHTGRVYIFYNDGTIPVTAATADLIITGQGASNAFGIYLISGDFNYDGREDLAVGARTYSIYTGRVYIFYNDGSIPTTAATADIIITGESSSYFGSMLASGDFNYDGRTDLAIGAYSYSNSTGRVYIFYNDGSIPTTATTADVIITGQAVSSSFGGEMSSGDLNYDGKEDLIVGAYGYSSSTGRVYIFYNDGNIPNNATGADLVITGQSVNSYFGRTIVMGDFNKDNRIDLVVGAYGYSTNAGRAYIFYNDGSIPTTAATADVILSGEASSNFGYAMEVGDINNDGRIDLAVGAYAYSSYAGRAYIFYNDGSIPTTAATADVIIGGQASSNYFGISMVAGDLNSDYRTDLIIGASGYSSNTGRVYIFYNDGTIPITAATADIIITGQGSEYKFGNNMIVGDFNLDRKTDLVVGTNVTNSTIIDRIFIFYNDGNFPSDANNADLIIAGLGNFDKFGSAILSGDFNTDGKIDLAIGSNGYNNYVGRIYIFYNDGSIPTTVNNADVIIDGIASFNHLGYSLASGDFNADGRTDICASLFGFEAGKVYIFYSQMGQISNSIGVNEVKGDINDGFGWFIATGDLNDDGKKDLIVSSYYYSSNAGRIYVFYNNAPTNIASGADVIITGEASSYFGYSISTGDFNGDGDIDLVVGAHKYLNPDIGRVYIFYNDGLYPSLASEADVIISGDLGLNGDDSQFGSSIIAGDFNYDGLTDLAVGDRYYEVDGSVSYDNGRVCIFYNDGSYPVLASGADVMIIGEAGNNQIGATMSMASGDFNNDGKIDLALGALGYSFYAGRVYIFYNDGGYPSSAGSADIIITGETSSNFGTSLISGDFNYDSQIDLAVGGRAFSSSAGRVYIFYNDGSIPIAAASADVIIDGEAISNFGVSLAAGDFNDDGKIDLGVGANRYLSWTGRVYIFYNDGSYPASSVSADIIIEGEDIGDEFGYSLCEGDFNDDGNIDLIVGSYSYLGDVGRVYIFYNDGSYPSQASDAEHKITGDTYGSYFGATMISGDFNNDSKTDLVVGAYGHTAGFGKVYLFYNDGSMPTTPETADVIISGEAQESWFGSTLSSGDLNSDNQTDLIIGAKGYSTNKGRVYIIYNDGSYPSLATDADIKIDGENDNDNFGYSITTGDIIGDSKTDLIIGATGYNSNTGRTYIINNDGSISTLAANSDIKIDGQNSNDNFGISLITGDFDYDMDNDLVVGSNYNTNTGRAYIFNNDGSYPTLAANSDIKIDGENTNNYFSNSFTKGDFNNDNRIDLVIGAYGYSNNTGRVYIFNNDGTIPTTAASADNIITGESSDNYFGYSLIDGDFNLDKKTDFVSGAHKAFYKGFSYIFYNDGSYPNNAKDAEVISSGKLEGDNFGISFATGDFDNNKKIDLCVGYLSIGWSGGFYFYTTDAEGTKPTYTEVRGNGGTLRGTMMVR